MSAKQADDLMSLFTEAEARYRQKAQPLAALMQSRTLAEFAENSHASSKGPIRFQAFAGA